MGEMSFAVFFWGCGSVGYQCFQFAGLRLSKSARVISLMLFLWRSKSVCVRLFFCCVIYFETDERDIPFLLFYVLLSYSFCIRCAGDSVFIFVPFYFANSWA